MMTDDNAHSRRQLLEIAGGTASVATITAVAGCTDETSGDPANDTDRNDGQNDGSTTPDEDESDSADDSPMRPVLFVHGGMGSATQFESQAMRFASNGYPQALLATYEYDSLAFEDQQEAIIAGLVERIEELRIETEAEQVDVVAHSLGTAVMAAYLVDPERAASVANYVNIDGREHDGPPGGVETLAIWAIGADEPEIEGAETVTLEQGHVEAATSTESFGAMFEFLTGTEPETTTIDPEPATDVTLSGRATLFPSNVGVETGTLEVYECHPKTGTRQTTVTTTTLDADGQWGPIDVDGTAHHEFVVTREDAPVQHTYRQPELRTNSFVRLHLGEPGGFTDDLLERGPEHAVIVVNRDKEWWADQHGASDTLRFNGTDIITEETAALADGIISPMVFDADSDGETDVSEPVPAFELVPFLTGVNMHLPAADPPDDTISIRSQPRDGDGFDRRVKIPNYRSDEHRQTVQFPDHTQVRSP